MVRSEELLIGVRGVFEKCTANGCPEWAAKNRDLLKGETTPTKGKICEDGILESKRMENPLKLKRIHHIEFWVGNARQAAYFYRKGFGFSQVAYRGLETGQRQRTSYALSQGKANFVLTTPMTPDDLAADHIRKHGDGVRDIALEVEDADQAYADAVRRGAEAGEEPQDMKDEHGRVRGAAVHTYGDTIHSLISYKDYKGPFLPGFIAAPLAGEDCGILRIDNIIGKVEIGKIKASRG